MLPTWRRSDPRLPDLKLDAHPTEPSKPADFSRMLVAYRPLNTLLVTLNVSLVLNVVSSLAKLEIETSPRDGGTEN